MLPTHEDAARIVAIRRQTQAERTARDRGFVRDRQDDPASDGAPARPIAPRDVDCRPCPPATPGVRQASTMAR